MTKEQQTQIKEHINRLQGEDISFVSLIGEKNSFNEANEARKEYLNELSGFLEKYGNYSDGHEWLFKDNLFANLNSFLTQLESYITQIKTTVRPDGTGVHDPNFPTQRQIQTMNIVNQRQTLKTYIQDALLAIELLELKQIIPNLQGILAHARNIEQMNGRLQKEEPKINAILEKIKDTSFLKNIETSKQRFDSLAQEHKDKAFNWFLGLLASIGFGLAAATYFFFWSDPPPLSDFKVEAYSLYKYFLFSHVFKKLLVVSVAVIGIRLCLNKYNAEKNLQIIYDHRVAALKIFQEFEGGLDLEPTAKINMRLEIGKLLFSDPQTGYIKSGDADFNFNPIVNMQDAMKGKIDSGKTG
jgi:hypothetical protein